METVFTALIVWFCWILTKLVIFFVAGRINRNNMKNLDALKEQMNLGDKTEAQRQQAMRSFEGLRRTWLIERQLSVAQAIYGPICSIAAIATSCRFLLEPYADSTTNFILVSLAISLATGIKMLRVKIELVSNHHENLQYRGSVEEQF